MRDRHFFSALSRRPKIRCAAISRRISRDDHAALFLDWKPARRLKTSFPNEVNQTCFAKCQADPFRKEPKCISTAMLSDILPEDTEWKTTVSMLTAVRASFACFSIACFLCFLHSG